VSAVPDRRHGTELARLASEIRTEVEQADQAWQNAVGHAVRAGELLLEAKSQVKHGDWLPWLEANFSGSTRTAQGYMRLARRAEDAQELAHLGVEGALKQLAAPKPEADPDEAAWITWQTAGERLEGKAPMRLEKFASQLSASDDEHVAAAYLDYLLQDVAPGVYLRTGKELPVPPIFRPDESEVRRAQVWELCIAWHTGGLLNQLEKTGLFDRRRCKFTLEPEDVKLDGAEEVLDAEAGEFNWRGLGWGDRDLRWWAIGHAAFALFRFDPDEYPLRPANGGAA
jgi:hypothetical protein